MIIRLVAVILLLLVACKSLDSNPELKDPIYGDLIRQAEEAKREVASATKELETAHKDLEAADVQNGESRMRRQVVFDIQQRLDKARQKEKYLELEMERRLAFDRRSYQKAFDKDEEWPDPAEYSAYMANKRLNNAPTSYDETHKMRLQERAPANHSKKASPSAHE